MFRQIIPHTDPRMTKPSAPIDKITDEIKTLAADMIETMIAADGAGLAAVQVGEPVRMFVMLDVPGATALPTKERLDLARRLVLINPAIHEHSEETIELDEGCLSMPGIFFPVKRWRKVTVEFTTLDGVAGAITAMGYKSICLQHELDHLDGVRNIDRVSPLKRMMLTKQFADKVRRRRQGR